jgi:hypothetical protein
LNYHYQGRFFERLTLALAPKGKGVNVHSFGAQWTTGRAGSVPYA